MKPRLGQFVDQGSEHFLGPLQVNVGVLQHPASSSQPRIRLLPTQAVPPQRPVELVAEMPGSTLSWGLRQFLFFSCRMSSLPSNTTGSGLICTSSRPVCFQFSPTLKQIGVDDRRR
jgi:hypothetical protein